MRSAVHRAIHLYRKPCAVKVLDASQPQWRAKLTRADHYRGRFLREVVMNLTAALSNSKWIERCARAGPL